MGAPDVPTRPLLISLGRRPGFHTQRLGTGVNSVPASSLPRSLALPCGQLQWRTPATQRKSPAPSTDKLPEIKGGKRPRLTVQNARMRPLMAVLSNTLGLIFRALLSPLASNAKSPLPAKSVGRRSLPGGLGGASGKKEREGRFVPSPPSCFVIGIGPTWGRSKARTVIPMVTDHCPKLLVWPHEESDVWWASGLAPFSRDLTGHH